MKPQDPKLVEDLFDTVSKKYDFLNDLFSFGLHRIWKRQLLRYLRPQAGENWIDLCCGTGDLSFLLGEFVRPSGSVIGLDFSQSQILIAKNRCFNEPLIPVSWRQGDALQTGLPSSSFDGAVMAYGLRNLSNPKNGLKEIHRLLKPRAKAGILDFNRTKDGSKESSFQKFYLRKIVVPIASFFGLREEYSYLEKSLENLPFGSMQKILALEVGFSKATYRILAGGQMGILLLEA